MKQRTGIQRGRPPRAESLPIPHRILKELTKLSEASGIKRERVWIDFLENGVVSTRLMYESLMEGHKTLIEYRKSLREQLDGAEEVNEVSHGTSMESEDAGMGNNGSNHGRLDGATPMVVNLPELGSTDERFDLAPVGPGLGAEGDEAIASD